MIILMLVIMSIIMLLKEVFIFCIFERFLDWFLWLTILTRERSSWSGWNQTWNFFSSHSLSSNDCTQNFSCWYTVQGCEKIAQSWNLQFRFTTVHVHDGSGLAVALCSPVHLNRVRGPGADKAVKGLTNVTHTYMVNKCVHRNNTFYVRNQA
jgi:hypothetical protein